MKKLLAVLLSAMMICSFAACAKTETKTDAAADSSQIPNPFEDCDTLDDAAKLAGFEITVPDSVDGYSTRTIQAIKDQMIQVIYAEGDSTLTMRKGTGTEDISGDYNEYAENNTVSVGGLDITMKGADGKVSVAIWMDGDYAFAVSVSTAVDSAAMSTLVSSVK